MQIVRRAQPGDLHALIALYRHLTPDMPTLSEPLAASCWAEILSDDRMAVFMAESGGVLAASCTLIMAPNLMRGGTPHGFLENVVTHADHRRRGHGKAVISAALGEAWSRNCQRVLLVTGRMRLNPYVLDFYENSGFESGRAGLTAHRPLP